MAKYIDADRLKAEIERNTPFHHRVYMKIPLALIDYLQQEQSIIEEDLVEKRKQECVYRKLSANGNYQCERYEGSFGPCDERCSWIVDYPKLKKLEKQPEVDLEKEIHKKVLELHTAPCYNELASFARHFYELKLNTKK